ncbi:MAG: hypothetical protein R3F54_23880 [Alphaproteobacteria bacterium]
MKNVLVMVALYTLLPVGQSAHAQQASGGSVAAAAPSNNGQNAQTPAGAGKGSSSKGNWLGLNLGVGLSVTFDNGQDKRVESASLDENRIVRVDDEENSVARILLEGHYFFPCDIRHLWKDNTWTDQAINHSFFSDRCGFGPFVAIQPGEDEIVDAAAIGLMVGFKYADWLDVTDNSSFNLGVGLVVDPDGRILGDDVEENEPLPAGETSIRFKEKQQYGWLLLASFSF